MNKKENLKFIYKYAKKYAILFLIADLCILIMYGITFLIPQQIIRLVNLVFQAELYYILPDIIKTLLTYFLINSAANLLYSFLWQKLNSTFVVDVKNDLYKKLLYTKPANLNSLNTGDIMSRLDSDADQFISFIQRNIFHFINSVILCMVILLYVARISIILSLVLLLFSLLPIFLTVFFSKDIDKLSQNQRENNGEITNKIFEYLNKFSQLKIINGFPWATSKLFGLFRKEIDYNNQISKKHFLLEKLVYIINLICSIIIYIITIFLMQKNQITLGLFIGIIQYVAILHRKFNWILRIYLDYRNRHASIARVREIIELPDEKNERDLIEINNVEEIIFKNVSFGYEKDKKILDNVSFVIKKDDKTALTGKSGSGKTTIISLLLKFYEPDSGEILINGINIKNISAFSIRKNICVIQQNYATFMGDILFNLTFGNDYQIQEIETACNNAKTLRGINNFPDKFKTKLDSYGSGLSGGQKQRIMIARGLLRDCSLIILDEATSSLDVETEKGILENISKLNKTIISISHRKEALSICNKFIEV